MRFHPVFPFHPHHHARHGCGARHADSGGVGAPFGHAFAGAPHGRGGHPGRGPGGPHGDGFSGFGGRGGDGREGRGPRLFAGGDLKLLALDVVRRQPSHGYEVIKAIEQLVGGDYSPSPGTIYPTLTLLEDMGFVRGVEAEGGRRRYEITAEGQAHLDAQREALERLLARLDRGRDAAQARGAPEIRRAMQNLRTALQLRFADGKADPAVVRRVAEILDEAAVAVERI